jgi:hypothetical protein
MPLIEVPVAVTVTVSVWSAGAWAWAAWAIMVAMAPTDALHSSFLTTLLPFLVSKNMYEFPLVDL